MTTDASTIEKLVSACRRYRTPGDPFARVLVTPLFSRPSTLKAVERLKANGSIVYFDSAGYYVQQDKISYADLVSALRRTYRENMWADRYVLPDYVPTSKDSDTAVREKVKQTVRATQRFFLGLPSRIQEKAIPVVHGRSRRDMDECLTAYFKLGVKTIAFGSLGTVGRNGAGNVVTYQAAEMIRYVTAAASAEGIRVHLFGVGVPAVVGLLPELGVGSFDSASWMKAAGFGQVFFPFSRSFSLKYRDGQPFRRKLSAPLLRRLQRITRHSCRFCASLDELRSNRIGRMIHNVSCIVESVRMIERRRVLAIREIYAAGSSRYRARYLMENGQSVPIKQR